MYCHKCGKTLPDDARFCPNCGVEVAAVASGMPEEFRKQIYDRLATTTFNSLETGEISVVDSRLISEYILGHLDNVNNRAQLSAFLAELTKRWDIFESDRSYLKTCADLDQLGRDQTW